MLSEDGCVLFSGVGVFTAVCAKPVGVELFTFLRIGVRRNVWII